MKYGKEKHGQLGRSISLRMHPDVIVLHYKVIMKVGTYSPQESERLLGGSWFVPLEVATDVLGDYEVVCEFGTEVHYYNGEKTTDEINKQQVTFEGLYPKTTDFIKQKKLSDNEITDALEWYFKDRK